jgi:hypothetical protein
MSHWLSNVWIWIWDISVVLHLSLFHVENRVCLSHGVQVAGAAWRAAMRMVAGVGDLMQRTVDGRTGRVLDGRAIGRLGDAICGLHRAQGDKKRGFLGWANQDRRFVSGLASKPLGWFVSGLASKPLGWFSPLLPQPVATISPGLASKSVATISRFGHRKRQLRFSYLCLKITTTIFLFGPQN